MRKIFITMASIVLSLVMCFSALTGCGLITTDSERDMNQVVATISISANAPKDEIKKKDMVMAYLNYGYMYEQYYGYSREQTFTLIIDSLVNNRIYVQNIIDEKNGDTNDWNVENYITNDSKVEAKYSTYKAMDDLVKSYEEAEEAEKSDSLWGTVRTVPTNAANEEKEVDKEQYLKDIDTKGFDVSSTPDRRNAFNKVIELLRVNELLGKDYKGKIEETDYFKQTLKNYQEAELIERYENDIKKDVRTNSFSFAKLDEAYKNKLNDQKDWTNADFVSKLSSATASDPILYGQNGIYGYVYNLLLGIDGTVLSDKITNIRTEYKDKFADENNPTLVELADVRKEILAATTVKDLRSSWILSGYDSDYNADTKILKFTGDYTFTTAANSLKFYGDVKKVKDASDDKNAVYAVKSVKEFTLAEFVAEMETYVYGGPQTADSSFNLALNPEIKNSVYKKVTSNLDIEEYDEKINELLFAFSTDPGALNTFKGYTVKPTPDGSDSEEYMKEFADGARELLRMGGTSYVMVATDYGYHVMFFSELLDTNFGYSDLEAYLDAEYGEKDWATSEYEKMVDEWDEYEDTQNYLYLLCNSLSDSVATKAVENKQNQMLNTYRYESDEFVKLYTDRYADLLK